MDDLSDLGQRTHGSCTDTRDEQQLGEILRAAFGGGRQIPTQASGDDVFGSDIVVSRHDEMRQHRLGLRARPFDASPLKPRELPLDPIRSKRAKNVELSLSRGLRAPIGQVPDGRGVYRNGHRRRVRTSRLEMRSLHRWRRTAGVCG